MFDNIGGKIKTLAIVLCGVGIVASFIGGIVTSGMNQSPWGMLVAVAGALASWILSFFIYGFGELIEKVTEIAENTKK